MERCFCQTYSYNGRFPFSNVLSSDLVFFQKGIHMIILQRRESYTLGDPVCFSKIRIRRWKMNFWSVFVFSKRTHIMVTVVSQTDSIVTSIDGGTVLIWCLKQNEKRTYWTFTVISITHVYGVKTLLTLFGEIVHIWWNFTICVGLPNLFFLQIFKKVFANFFANHSPPAP